MRKTEIFFALILGILLPLQLQAKIKQAVIFGGGGEPAGQNGTIFDNTFESYMQVMGKANWSTSSYFDSGHPATEKMTANLTKNKNQAFTKKNFDKSIEDLKNEIKSGKLKAGDQLFVQISTHGAEKSPHEFTHEVSTVDGITDLSKLAELRDLAETHGVKLAIADMSCHSGATQDLASPKTCVVSMAGLSVGYSGDAKSFTNAIVSGKNLEDVFLAGRLNNSTPGLPQISSPAGRMAYSLMKNVESDSLYFAEDPNQVCEDILSTDNFKKLLRDLDNIEKKNPSGNGIGSAKSELVSSIQIYDQHRKAALDIFQKAQAANKKYCLKSNKKSCVNFDKLETLSEMMAQRARSSEERNEYEGAMKSPEYKRWSALQAKYQAQAQGLKQYAFAVGDKERAAYNVIYKKFASGNNSADPCKDFVF